MSSYRGYYNGLSNMTPTAVSEVFEAADRIIEAADWLNLMLTGEERRSSCMAGRLHHNNLLHWFLLKYFPEVRLHLSRSDVIVYSWCTKRGETLERELIYAETNHERQDPYRPAYRMRC